MRMPDIYYQVSWLPSNSEQDQCSIKSAELSEEADFASFSGYNDCSIPSLLQKDLHQTTRSSRAQHVSSARECAA